MTTRAVACPTDIIAGDFIRSIDYCVPFFLQKQKILERLACRMIRVCLGTGTRLYEGKQTYNVGGLHASRQTLGCDSRRHHPPLWFSVISATSSW